MAHSNCWRKIYGLFVGGGELACSERGSANVRKFGFHWAGGPKTGLHGTALVAIVVCRGGFETACGPVDWRSICPTNRLERSGVGVLSEGDDVPDESASFGSNTTARGSTVTVKP